MLPCAASKVLVSISRMGARQQRLLIVDLLLSVSNNGLVLGSVGKQAAAYVRKLHISGRELLLESSGLLPCT